MSVKLSLTSVAAFQFVSKDATAKLARIAKIVEKGATEAVLMAGETVPGIYIVAEGIVGVYPAGAPRPLVTLGQGASFGEMSFLEKSKASATIRAEVKATTLVLLTQAELGAMVEGDPELGRALYRGLAVSLSQKLRTTTDKLTTELAAGRKLLDDLQAADATGAVGLIPEEMEKEHRQTMASLDRLAKVTQDLVRRFPDRTSAFAEIDLAVGEVRSRCLHHFPRLIRDVAAIAAFVKRMEEFILYSTRD